MLEATHWISGRLRCVTAGDLDTLIVKRVAETEPIARSVVFPSKCGASSGGAPVWVRQAAKVELVTSVKQINATTGWRRQYRCHGRSPLASHAHIFLPPEPA